MVCTFDSVFDQLAWSLSPLPTPLSHPTPACMCLCTRMQLLWALLLSGPGVGAVCESAHSVAPLSLPFCSSPTVLASRLMHTEYLAYTCCLRAEEGGGGRQRGKEGEDATYMPCAWLQVYPQGTGFFTAGEPVNLGAYTSHKLSHHKFAIPPASSRPPSPSLTTCDVPKSLKAIQGFRL